LMIGDDSEFLPFIPNSDDPTYDYTYDVDEHQFFAWHQPNRDPDCAAFDSSWIYSFFSQFFFSSVEVINIETTRSLLQDHGMTLENVDRSGILPLPANEIIRLARRRYDFSFTQNLSTIILQ
jgi:histone-lysine N-methyltransferase EZH2